MVARVFIDGAAGTTGLEIAERLASRSDVSLIELPEEERKSAAARAEAINQADVVILCLPDAAAREAVGLARHDGVRFIDASSAHRVADGWVYGFAELREGQRDAIRNAARVSNPGCYPTGFLALVAPLVGSGLIPSDHGYTVNAVSGYSGGGKELIRRMQVDEPSLGFRSYALSLEHKHLPEMQVHARLARAPLFAPAVIRAFRGMMVDVPLFLDPELGFADAPALHALLTEHYDGEALITVAPFEPRPTELLLHEGAEPTDAMVLHVLPSDDGSMVRLVALLDNLGKGASGAAVQNLNLMCGLEELAGLRA